VAHADRFGNEGSRASADNLVLRDQLRFAFENEECVDVVDVGVRLNASPTRMEGQVEDRELRQLALDHNDAIFPLEALALARKAGDRLRERAAAVLGRILLVEVIAPVAANVVAEAHARRVHVEEDRGRIARVHEGVDYSGRSGDVGAGTASNRVDVGPEPEFDLALENVEGVRVVPMDVRVRTFLARFVAEPRDDQLLELGQDAQRPLRPVSDRLAFAGA